MIPYRLIRPNSSGDRAISARHPKPRLRRCFLLTNSASRIRAYCLGLGADPLTFALDLLTAVVIDAPLYDELFGEMERAETGTLPRFEFKARRWTDRRREGRDVVRYIARD